MTTTTIKFRGGENLTETLAMRQSGSLEKGLVEAIQNCFDSKATEIDITIDQKSFTIRDNGHGFYEESHIDDFFAKLGFDHSQGIHADESRLSVFGMGRFQLMAFAKVDWRSHTFKMSTDLYGDNAGKKLGFVKETGLAMQEGCVCSGELYRPLFPRDYELVVNQLIKRVKYFQGVVIRINGQMISQTIEKPDVETDQYIIKFHPQSNMPIEIYNRGIYVSSLFDANLHGCILISKQNLALNTARDDVLRTKCAIWKDARAVMKKKNEEDWANIPSNGFNKSTGTAFLSGLLSGEIDADNVRSLARKRCISSFPSTMIDFDDLKRVGSVGFVDATLIKRKDTPRNIAGVILFDRSYIVSLGFMDGEIFLRKVLGLIGVNKIPRILTTNEINNAIAEQKERNSYLSSERSEQAKLKELNPLANALFSYYMEISEDLEPGSILKYSDKNYKISVNEDYLTDLALNGLAGALCAIDMSSKVKSFNRHRNDRDALAEQLSNFVRPSVSAPLRKLTKAADSALKQMESEAKEVNAA